MQQAGVALRVQVVPQLLEEVAVLRALLEVLAPGVVALPELA